MGAAVALAPFEVPDDGPLAAPLAGTVASEFELVEGPGKLSEVELTTGTAEIFVVAVVKYCWNCSRAASKRTDIFLST